MADEHGQLRYDDPNLPAYAEGAALTLRHYGTLACTVAGFSTANALIATTQDAVERGTLFQRPAGLSPVGNDDYTLWLRADGNAYSGAWLFLDSRPGPDYLIEKGLADRLPDALVLSTFITLVDEYRLDSEFRGISQQPHRIEKRNDLIAQWAERAGRELPAFLSEGTQPSA